MENFILPPHAAACCETLRRAGWEAYPVGGCVRDLLLGRTPGDWDVCTSAPPEVTSALFPKVALTGARHGTVTVLAEGGPVEVTTFRSDGTYSDGRHPDAVTFGGTLEGDLARRDFTVNAMALGPSGEIVDPFGGRADLERRLLRCVGDPVARFREDALRILRGVRFAAQLGFAIEAETAAAMEACAPLISRVSAERVTAEMEKILLSPAPRWAGELVRLGALDRFAPASREPDWAALDAVPPERTARWQAFCNLTGFPIGALPVSRALRRAVEHPELDALRTLALSGGELYALGLRGEAIGAAQKRLARHVLAHPEDNTRGRLLELLDLSGQ